MSQQLYALFAADTVATENVCTFYVKHEDRSILRLQFDQFRSQAQLAMTGGVVQPRILTDLIALLALIYSRTEDAEHASLAIRIGAFGVQVIQPNQPGFGPFYQMLGGVYWVRYLKTRQVDDVNQAVRYSSIHKHIQSGITGSLLDQYGDGRDLKGEACCITIAGITIANIPVGGAMLAYQMVVLGNQLFTGLNSPENLKLIDYSITVVEVALWLTAFDHEPSSRSNHEYSMTARTLLDLATNLTKFGQAVRVRQAASVINAAVTIFERLRRSYSEDVGIAKKLAIALVVRHRLYLDGTDLDRSIQVFEEAQNMPHAPVSGRMHLLYTYSNAVHDRFLRDTNKTDDLEHAIALVTEALTAPSSDPVLRFEAGTTLARYLGDKYFFAGRSSDVLTEAINVGDSFLSDVPVGTPPMSLATGHTIHGNNLGHRFRALPNESDLRHALLHSETALQLADKIDDPAAKKQVDSSIGPQYAALLLDRFGQDQDINDLNHAITWYYRFYRSTPDLDMVTAFTHARLARALRQRFERVGSKNDLDQSIEILQPAVNILPHGTTSRSTLLNILSNSYQLRFTRDRHTQDLDRAIENLEAAITEIPAGKQQNPVWLCNLARSLTERAQMSTLPSGDQNRDLEDSIRHSEHAIELTSNEPLQQPFALMSLGLAFDIRFVSSKRRSDADLAIENLERADAAFSEHRQDDGICIYRLGIAHFHRFDKMHDRTDLKLAAGYWEKAFATQRCSLVLRVKSACGAIVAFLGLYSHDQKSTTQELPEKNSAVFVKLMQLMKGAIGLVPLLVPRSLPRPDRQKLLSEIGGIASVAAALALEAGECYEALVYLEGSRGILASLMMETHMNGSMLGDKLASELNQAREHLEMAHRRKHLGTPDLGDGENALHAWISQSQDLYAAEVKLQEVLQKIRANSEVRRYLEPPTIPELVEAVNDDVWIVVTASPYRCDAILIDKEHGITVIPLVSLTMKDITRHVARLRKSRPYVDVSILEWLWDDIAKPILEHLGCTEIPSDTACLRRIVWILTGSLSRLPIHAAGYHLSKSGATVMDRVMSSYATSLRDLVHASLTQYASERSASAKKALLVIMSKTPGRPERDLPHAATEAEKLKGILPLLGEEPVTLPQQTRAAVLKQLSFCDIFHFAGHGHADATVPTESGLELEDGRLTVGDLHDHRLGEQTAFLGYLSSCLTGANDGDRLEDESIHLVSACLLAGFRHAIGALWQVYDSSCVQVAEDVYREMAENGVTDRSVCVGLYKALLRLRDNWIHNRSGATTREVLVEERDNNASADDDFLARLAAIEDWNKGIVADDEVLDMLATIKLDFEDDSSVRYGTPRWTGTACTEIRADWVPFVHYGP